MTWHHLGWSATWTKLRRKRWRLTLRLRSCGEQMLVAPCIICHGGNAVVSWFSLVNGHAWTCHETISKCLVLHDWYTPIFHYLLHSEAKNWGRCSCSTIPWRPWVWFWSVKASRSSLRMPMEGGTPRGPSQPCLDGISRKLSWTYCYAIHWVIVFGILCIIIP